MARKSKKFKLTRKALISAAGVVVVAAAGLGLWHHYNKPAQELIPSTASKSSLPSSNASSKSSTGGGGSSSYGSDKQANSSVSNASNENSTTNPSDGTGNPPATPTGQFVSSHPAGKSMDEQSACITTPGASCYIQFTQGNVLRTLQPQLTDANGGAIWNWNTSYLNSGNWQVSAVATLNGQTKTASDTTPLTIQ